MRDAAPHACVSHLRTNHPDPTPAGLRFAGSAFAGATGLPAPPDPTVFCRVFHEPYLNSNEASEVEYGYPSDLGDHTRAPVDKAPPGDYNAGRIRLWPVKG